ncbi:MAG: hypothetical protein PHE56_03310 [Bacteroidales bacterium]|nr:hypothetical protein [Bacteroidales bacterium]
MVARIEDYIKKVLGISVKVLPFAKSQLLGLPLYLRETYWFHTFTIFNQNLVLAEPKNEDEFSTLNIEKHFALLGDVLGKKIVFLSGNIMSYNRARLIEKGINFIVSDKQLFLPDLLIDLRENYTNPKSAYRAKSLLPSAQFLVLFHIINLENNNAIENISFKKIAKLTGYSPMAITKAVENLKALGLVEVFGGKEKYIRFRYNKIDLWNNVLDRQLFVNPVLKRVYADNFPVTVEGVKSNISALAVYTDLNEAKPIFYAIEKNNFNNFIKVNDLKNLNDFDGEYCIEVWKYNPIKLMTHLDNKTLVDRFSLYLSLYGFYDERVEMALTQLISDVVW